MWIAHLQRRLSNRWLDARERLSHGASLGVDLLFPPACVRCHVPLEPGPLGLCDDCKEQLIDRQFACLRCGLPTTILRVKGDSSLTRHKIDSSEDTQSTAPDAEQPLPNDGCLRCRHTAWKFSSVHRLGLYESALRLAVLQGKRGTGQSLAMALGNALAQQMANLHVERDFDLIVPVPMHWTRRIWRGVNGPETIARQISQDLGRPLDLRLLRRRRRTMPQTRLSAQARQKNVRGAFHAVSHRRLLGRRVLLVDDIMTTGATLNEAAKTLRHAGAATVVVAVVARAEI